MPISASALWLNATFAGFDQSIATAIHKLYEIGGAFFTPFMSFLGFLVAPVTITCIALLLAFCKKTRHFGLAFLVSITVGVILTNGCLKLIVARPRPYTDESSIFYQFWLMVGQKTESDNSFPSGHATAAFASMTAMYLRCDRRWSWTAYLAAILVAVSRIYLCVHYPSDVLVGVFVGLLAGFIGTAIAVRLPKVCYEVDLIALGKKNFLKQGKHLKGGGK